MTIVETSAAAPPLPPPTDQAVDLPAPGSWSIQWRGHRYDEEDLTGQHLSVIALITGQDDWASLDVDPRRGHQRLMTMIAAFRAVDATAGVDADEVGDVVARVVHEVRVASADEILGALRYT